jgi:hypothetical protein
MRPVFVETKRKHLKRMPRSVRKVLRQRPRLVLATYKDDDRKMERHVNRRYQ